MSSRPARASGPRARPSGQRMPSPTRRPASRSRSTIAHFVPVLLFVIGYLVVSAVWPLPLWVAALYLIASILCFIVYAVDKSAATAQRRRVPENTLLWLGIIGGWPGAIIAQQTLRHKTQKVSFRRAFWATVAANLLVFAVFATPVFTLSLDWIQRSV